MCSFSTAVKLKELYHQNKIVKYMKRAELTRKHVTSATEGLPIKTKQNTLYVKPDPALIFDSLPTGGELRDYFLTFWIKKWIYPHSCLSTWLQQWSAEVTSIVTCLSTLMLTADWLEEKCSLFPECNIIQSWGQMKRWSWWVLNSLRVDVAVARSKLTAVM